MNISTGGPHILFFERDQQLTALLTSEFQLAGYECHAARTAVEVFDTIARFPVRMLLVNLAQAAAGRREFWVALDTQRRGRGVQVLTYLCSNLAAYGPRDTDDRQQTQAVDVEIDGMLGVMNLVDAVRERIPGPGSVSSINTQPRLPKVTQAPPPDFATSSTRSRQADTANGTMYRTGPLPDAQSYQTPRTQQTVAPTQTIAPATTLNPQSYSEKIRAVLYPAPTQQRATNSQEASTNTRTFSSPQEVEQPVTYNYEIQQRVPQNRQQDMQNVQESMASQSYSSDATALQQLAYGSRGTRQESGLDQLSRLLQERRTPTRDTNEGTNNTSSAYRETREAPENLYVPATPVLPVEQTTVDYVQTPHVTENIDVQSLRASPIEDLPRERMSNGSTTNENVRRNDTAVRSTYGYTGQAQNNQPAAAQATPLASIATLRTPQPVVTKATLPIPSVQPVLHASLPVEEPVPAEYFSASTQAPAQEIRPVQQAVQETPVAHSASDREDDAADAAYTDDATPSMRRQRNEDEEERDEVEEKHTTQEPLQQEYVSMQNILQGHSGAGIAPNNAMLLDIVQSLPLMPSPPPSPLPTQAVSGRTMRTLGSVLLEGHLVPESRLEVAQNIQRMLRGVDLNYQLGEILLMFKLLTPDQLLAASLVSYGMISTQQISALGRIRQELHAIGLEYDLESLLILFRMLTPEQLREVRANWLG